MTKTLARSHGLRMPTLATLLREPIRPREYLLEPLLRDGESMMIWADAGIGKTMLSLTLALAIAGGGELLGWKASGGRRVLLVDGEMNMGDLIERFRSLMGGVTGLDREAAAQNITVLARQGQEPDTRFPDLADGGDQDRVFEIVRKGGFDLVILDNFSTLANVEDENAAAAMYPVLSFLMRLKQAGVACILIHHSGKNGVSYRGSSRLAATFEVIMGLTKPTGSALRFTTAFDIQWNKFRGRRGESTRGISVWLEEGDYGALFWHWELSKREEAERVVERLRTGNYGTQEELAKAHGCSTGKMSTDPPPSKWSDSRYGFWPEEDRRWHARDTSPKRSSRSCGRLTC